MSCYRFWETDFPRLLPQHRSVLRRLCFCPELEETVKRAILGVCSKRLVLGVGISATTWTNRPGARRMSKRAPYLWMSPYLFLWLSVWFKKMDLKFFSKDTKKIVISVIIILLLSKKKWNKVEWDKVCFDNTFTLQLLPVWIPGAVGSSSKAEAMQNFLFDYLFSDLLLLSGIKSLRTPIAVESFKVPPGTVAIQWVAEDHTAKITIIQECGQIRSQCVRILNTRSGDCLSWGTLPLSRISTSTT